MARLKQAKTEEEIKTLTLSGVKKAYVELADDYNKIIEGDVVYCSKCNSFHSRATFYSDKEYASGLFPICKKCILAMVEQRDKKNDTSKENKSSVKRVLQMMNLPYIDSLYESAKKIVDDQTGEKNKRSPFSSYIVQVKSLPQYSNRTWADSEFEYNIITDEDEAKENAEIIKRGKKRFGRGYSNEDYMFLETEYTDWTDRYPCENKSQELLYRRVCFKQLDIDKAQKTGKDTKELDKSLQEILGALGIKPSQSNSNALTDSKTFGQLIQIWENEKPIPEPEEEFKDVDKIGLYIDVFFKGHLSKMMGLKNAFSTLYTKFMAKYTVQKPQYDEDTDTEMLFDQIFGSSKLED